jgi:hypothetical protein
MAMRSRFAEYWGAPVRVNIQLVDRIEEDLLKFRVFSQNSPSFHRPRKTGMEPRMPTEWARLSTVGALDEPIQQLGLDENVAR